MKTSGKWLAGLLSCVVVLAVWAQTVTVVSVVSPSVLVLASKSTVAVTVHAQVRLSLVQAGTVRLNGVAPYAVFADNRGELVAKFDLATIKAMVTPPEATLTLTAVMKDGSPLVGVDTITVR